MNTPHTPGPWKASGRYIAAGGYHLAVTTNAPPEMDQEWKANARLIAVSPTLLQAALLARDELQLISDENGGSHGKSLDFILEAINLATGQIP